MANTFLSNWWFCFGLFSFLMAVVNLIRALTKQSMAWELFSFLSLSSGMFGLLSEYQMIVKWVNAGDWSAIEDVAPSMGSFLLGAVVVIILLNAIVWLLNTKRKR